LIDVCDSNTTTPGINYTSNTTDDSTYLYKPDDEIDAKMEALGRVNGIIKRYKLMVLLKGKIDAAHFVPFVEKCKKLHGHTWHVEVRIFEDRFLEFGEVKKEFDEILQMFDHENLGAMTCEELAAKIYNLMSAKYKVASVTVWETEKQGVMCFGRKE